MITATTLGVDDLASARSFHACTETLLAGFLDLAGSAWVMHGHILELTYRDNRRNHRFSGEPRKIPD